ncbi:MAG: glutathione S-transferase family protein [Haliea sp.]
MKLFNVDHSPYATRVRMQIRKKHLPINIEAPPVALRTPEFLARYPLGKVPVLELDDGNNLGESWVIMEYLEALFPGSPLMPKEPLARAQAQLLTRYADTHLSPTGLFPLFKRLMAPGGTVGAEAEVEGVHAEMQRLERLLISLPPCQERSVHLGDIALVPSLSYATLVLPVFGEEDIFAGFPAATEWWQWVMSDRVIKTTDSEMRDAYRAFMASPKAAR